MHIKDCSHFQHDGTPCYQTKAIQMWLQDAGIEVIGPWPRNLPDLNPIENCRKILTVKVTSNNPTSLQDLQEKIKAVWVTEISPDYCDQLCTFIPHRIRAVLDNKGLHTKY